MYDDTSRVKERDARQMLAAPNDTIYVYFFPSEASDIPEHLREKHEVVFQFGYDMPIPIEHLMISSVGISGVLSFKGTKYHCYVSWGDVWRIIGSDGTDRRYAPPDWTRMLNPPHKDAIPPPPMNARTHLKVIDGGNREPIQPSAGVFRCDTSGRQAKNHLKVVK